MSLKNSFYLFITLFALLLLKITIPATLNFLVKNQHYFEFNDFAKVEINSLNNSLNIKRLSNNNWQINNLPASKKAIKNIHSSLENLSEAEFITDNIGKHHIFNFNSPTHNVSFIFNDNDSVHFAIGKRGPFIGSNYIRYKNDKSVYLVKDFLNLIYSADQDYWYDLAVIDLSNKKTKLLAFEVPNSTFSYILEDDKWFMFIDDTKQLMPESTIETFLNSFSPLVADNIYLVSKLPQEKLQKLKFKFKITTFDNKQSDLLFFHDKDNSFYVINQSNPTYVYWLKEVLFSGVFY